MLVQDFLQRGPHHIGMAAVCPFQLPCQCRGLPRSHGTEISLAIQILTPLSSSYLDLDFLPSHLSSDKHIRPFSSRQLSSSTFLVYFCRRTTFISLYHIQGLYSSPTANMQFQILALLSLVAFAFAAPIGTSTSLSSGTSSHVDGWIHTIPMVDTSIHTATHSTKINHETNFISSAINTSTTQRRGRCYVDPIRHRRFFQLS
jgi:hypothetical protein